MVMYGDTGTGTATLHVSSTPSSSAWARWACRAAHTAAVVCCQVTDRPKLQLAAQNDYHTIYRHMYKTTCCPAATDSTWHACRQTRCCTRLAGSSSSSSSRSSASSRSESPVISVLQFYNLVVWQQGGFAEVHLAEDKLTGKTVALKVVFLNKTGLTKEQVSDRMSSVI